MQNMRPVSSCLGVSDGSASAARTKSGVQGNYSVLSGFRYFLSAKNSFIRFFQ